MLHVFYAFVLMAASVHSADRSALAAVHRIYVDSMGHDEEAVRFRDLLRKDLAAAGFFVVDDPRHTDATLSGFVSIRVRHGYAKAYSTVTLTTADGRLIWGGDFGPAFRQSLSSDTVMLRSKDIAMRLKEDRETAVRTAALASRDRVAR